MGTYLVECVDDGLEEVVEEEGDCKGDEDGTEDKEDDAWWVWGRWVGWVGWVGGWVGKGVPRQSKAMIRRHTATRLSCRPS